MEFRVQIIYSKEEQTTFYSLVVLFYLGQQPVNICLTHKALAKVFRAKLLKELVDNKLQVPENCPPKWVVDCKNVGNGDKALIYLGGYLYR